MVHCTGTSGTLRAVGAVSQICSSVWWSIFLYIYKFHSIQNASESPYFGKFVLGRKGGRPTERVAATERNQLGSNMLTSLAKGIAAQGKRSMSTIRYAEYGHPLNVLKCVLSSFSPAR